MSHDAEKPGGGVCPVSGARDRLCLWAVAQSTHHGHSRCTLYCRRSGGFIMIHAIRLHTKYRNTLTSPREAVCIHRREPPGTPTSVASG